MNFHPFYNGPFSQWHPAEFVVDGVKYNCAEQFMMHRKAMLFGDRAAAKAIMRSDLPSEQKAIGREVKGFNDRRWCVVARDIVTVGSLAKFTQNASLRRALLATGDHVLVEASPTDRRWGVGLAEDDPRAMNPAEWRGLNWLGECLMIVRDALAVRRKQ